MDSLISVDYKILSMNPYSAVRDFENFMSSYVGSKYAIAVDNCTNAIFLCCKYLKVKKVLLPKRTYVSVPCAVIHAGGSVSFEDSRWIGSYQLKPYPIFDSACLLKKNMYSPGSFQCVSFSANKPVAIGKGGMIFTDDENANHWFRMARYSGRREIPLNEDEITMLGWNMYMTPEQASRGLVLASFLKEENLVKPKYPDLSRFEIYTRGM